MAKVQVDGDLYKVAYITGPSHVWLGLRFATKPQPNPRFLAHPPVGDCSHGSLSEAEILAAVTRGIAEFHPLAHVSEIQYVSNDSPNYRIYEQCAKLIAKHVAGGEG